jgi:hypothetical protein
VDDVGLFVASGHVIDYDPKEVIFYDQLSEDHVGTNIFYCLNNFNNLEVAIGSNNFGWVLPKATSYIF